MVLLIVRYLIVFYTPCPRAISRANVFCIMIDVYLIFGLGRNTVPRAIFPNTLPREIPFDIMHGALDGDFSVTQQEYIGQAYYRS